MATADNPIEGDVIDSEETHFATADPKSFAYKYWFLTIFPTTEAEILGFKTSAADGGPCSLENGNVEYPIHYITGQLELAPTTQRLHAHYYVAMEDKCNRNTIRVLFGKGRFLPVKHHKQCLAYVTKAQSKGIPRFAGPWEYGTLPDLKLRDLAVEQVCAGVSAHSVVEAYPALLPSFTGLLALQKETARLNPAPPISIPPTSAALLVQTTPRTWQTQAIQAMSGTPKKRQIFWIWSYEPATGKSSLVDYLLAFGPGLQITDYDRTVAHFKEGFHKYLLLDLPMSLSPKAQAKYAALLETFSNQTVQSWTKYKGGSVLVEAHVVVFSNRPPMPQLSHKDVQEIHATKT